MYYIEHENKIVLVDDDKQKIINTLEFMPQYKDCEILETDKEIENFMWVDSDEWVEWKTIHQKTIRNNYLETYIDPYVTNPLRWDDMSEEQKDEIKNYRKYLLSLDTREDFCKLTILTFDKWKEQQ